ncbi:MAG: serine/threonine protein kinase [Anaerolineae bacterium]|nr:serine/threonine protein kinase [Anaerolineae bacterium]
MDKKYSLKNIRALLTEGFTDEELRQLCFDEPAFRPVYNQLAESSGKSKIVQQLLEYTEQKELIKTLLDLVKASNPKKYEKYEPYYANTDLSQVKKSVLETDPDEIERRIIKEGKVNLVTSIRSTTTVPAKSQRAKEGMATLLELAPDDSKLIRELVRIIDQVEPEIRRGNNEYQHLIYPSIDEARDVCRLIRSLSDQLPANELLNDAEKFTASAAALLCNIGLYTPDLKSLSLTALPHQLGMDELALIWQYHPELSYQMIRRSAQRLPGYPYLGLDQNNPFIEPIALLCKGHEGEIALDDYEPGDWPSVGWLRLDLLVALLQLGSQLYLNRKRILTRRLREAGPLYQQRWWAYNYYEGPILKNWQIQLFFSIPQQYRDLQSSIRAFVEDPIRRTYNRVIPILRAYKIEPKLVDAKINLLETNVQTSMPEAVVTYLEHYDPTLTEILEDKLQGRGSSQFTSFQRRQGPFAIDDFLPGNRYQISEIIGTRATSNSYVYKAIDHQLNRRIVVVKEPAFLYDDQISTEIFNELQLRYKLELQILTKIRHPYIASVIDFVDNRYMIQEWVEGTSLREIIQQKERVPIEQVIKIGVEACEALHYAHEKSEVIHRDIKPEHVFYCDDGHIRIIDFGLAQAKGLSSTYEAITGPKPIFGTPAYMAPEQAQIGQVDLRADIFALGVTLYEMLMFERPYPRGAWAPDLYTTGYIPSPLSMIKMRSDIPRALEKCIQKAIALAPGDRFTSWLDFKDALQQVQLVTAEVIVQLESRLEEFSSIEQKNFIFALSSILKIKPDQIRILEITSGSVLVTLEMPKEAAQLLMSMFLAGESILQPLRITRVELRSPTTQSPLNVLPQETLEHKYSSTILAILDDDGDVVGTGFLVSHQGKVYAITCAHVLSEANKAKDQVVKLIHYSSKIGSLDAQVLWCQIPENTKPERLTARQDTAILKIISPLRAGLPLAHLEVPQNYRGITKCWCYAYVRSKGIIGDWIRGISCMEELSQQLVKLSQTGATKLEPGASGAPLSDSQGNLIGMIRAIYGNEIAYLIPSEVILEVLSFASATYHEVEN